MRHVEKTDLATRWRHQVHEQDNTLLRNVATLAIHVRHRATQGLVALKHITLFVLYTDVVADSKPRICINGFRPCLIAHGVEWAGPRSNILSKDLALRPSFKANAKRFDLSRTRQLVHALELYQRSITYRTNGQRIGRKFRLPRLWAGFHIEVAQGIEEQGPELDALCTRFCIPPSKMLQIYRRPYRDLLAFPLDWVSHLVSSASTILVEMDGLVRHQQLRLLPAAGNLAGYAGASEYDFRASRIRRRDYGSKLTPVQQFVAPGDRRDCDCRSI